jgi:hypothetical protein
MMDSVHSQAGCCSGSSEESVGTPSIVFCIDATPHPAARLQQIFLCIDTRLTLRQNRLHIERLQKSPADKGRRGNAPASSADLDEGPDSSLFQPGAGNRPCGIDLNSLPSRFRSLGGDESCPQAFSSRVSFAQIGVSAPSKTQIELTLRLQVSENEDGRCQELLTDPLTDPF